MNEAAKLIQEAIGGLKLRDITLHSASFRRPTPTESETGGEISAVLQTKRGVRFEIGEIKEPGNSTTVLRVFVELGTRIADAQGENPSVYIEIEAEFCAEYAMLADLREDVLKAFAQFNAVHNIWPFWRQHVFDTVQRARLSHIDVPLFSGSGSDSQEDEKPLEAAAESNPAASDQ